MIESYIILFLIIVFIIDCKKCEVGFSKNNADLYKGISALLIFFHHFSQRTINDGMFIYIGYLAVGAFFYASGYGLTKSYIKFGREYYKIILLKIPKLLVMMVLSIMFSSVFFFITERNLSLADYTYAPLGNRMLNWFFTAIIALYFVYTICIVIFTKKISLFLSLFIIICLISLLLVFLRNQNIIGSHWLMSLFSFWLGSFIGGNDWIDDLLFRHRCLFIVIFFGLVFFVQYLLIHYTIKGVVFKLLSYGLYNICSMLFSLGLYLFCSGYKSKRLLSMCGSLSAEMILVQNIALGFVKNSRISIDNKYLYLFICVVAESLLVLIFHKCVSCLFKHIIIKTQNSKY